MVTVELALTIGLAFFFFFAAFEFCRVSMIGHTAENAIYEGARAGITPGATVGEVEAETRRILSTIGVRNVSVSVVPAAIANDTPALSVSVNVPIEENLFSPVNFFAGKSIQRTFTMQREIVRD
jgi:hypothetical protein